MMIKFVAPFLGDSPDQEVKRRVQKLMRVAKHDVLAPLNLQVLFHVLFYYIYLAVRVLLQRAH